MKLFILAFFVSLICTFFLVRYQHIHEKVSNDYDFSGPQKFHTRAVPRIGGIAILLSLLTCAVAAHVILSLESGLIMLQICLCSLPTFTVGLIEDLTKKISVKTRLIITLVSALMSVYFLNALITKIDLPMIDLILSIGFIAILFTLIAITGLANAYNIIDGFNGLASMVAIISLLAIGYVAFKVSDFALASICLIVIGSISGFFLWNYPRGLIFLGDGGAYLIGYLIAILSILIVTRNPTVSPWFALLVNAYPIFETVFTIWRRKFNQGKNPSLPDGKHFHSLIYRRVLRWAEIPKSKQTSFYAKNARTSPYLWFLSSLAAFPAIIWWQTTWILQCFVLLFCISYLMGYYSIVKFKTPGILKFLK